MSEPSSYFEKAFMALSGGSPSAQCGCGRILFSSDSDYLQDFALSEFLQHSRDQPDKYKDLHCGDGVSLCEVLGRMYVYGCPCGYASKVESLLWENRKEILKYLGLRLREQRVDVSESETLFKEAL